MSENVGPNVGPRLEKQPHGGALQRGGSYPQSGRRPAVIRKKALRMLWRNLAVLEQIAQGVTVEFEDGGALKLATPRPGERVASLKLLKELAMGDEVPVADVRTRLVAQVELIRSRETWSSTELLDALGALWYE